MVTDVDDALVVADEQVAEDAGFIEVAQADHVLHSVDGGRVHGFDVGGVLRGNPVFLCVCVGGGSEEIQLLQPEYNLFLSAPVSFSLLYV